jgi:hypothetical protein
LALDTEDSVPDLPRHTGIEAQLATLVNPTLVDLGYELVRVAVLGRERQTVQIMADRADGTAFAVEDCERISHALGAVLDVADPLPQAWTLEVSSAGIDRPLTRLKDWTSHPGSSWNSRSGAASASPASFSAQMRPRRDYAWMKARPSPFRTMR